MTVNQTNFLECRNWQVIRARYKFLTSPTAIEFGNAAPLLFYPVSAVFSNHLDSVLYVYSCILLFPRPKYSRYDHEPSHPATSSPFGRLRLPCHTSEVLMFSFSPLFPYFLILPLLPCYIVCYFSSFLPLLFFFLLPSLSISSSFLPFGPHLFLYTNRIWNEGTPQH